MRKIGVMSMKLVGKAVIGFFAWLFRAVFKWVM